MSRIIKSLKPIEGFYHREHRSKKGRRNKNHLETSLIKKKKEDLKMKEEYEL